jgi:hypothetical protein
MWLTSEQAVQVMSGSRRQGDLQERFDVIQAFALSGRLSLRSAWQAAASSHDRMGRRTNGSRRYTHRSSQAATNNLTQNRETDTAKKISAGVRQVSVFQKSRAKVLDVFRNSHVGGTLITSTDHARNEGRLYKYPKLVSSRCHHRLSRPRKSATLLPIRACQLYWLLLPAASIYLSITHSLTHSFINHYYWHGHVLGSFHPILSLCSYVSGVCITLGV